MDFHPIIAIDTEFTFFIQGKSSGLQRMVSGNNNLTREWLCKGNTFKTVHICTSALHIASHSTFHLDLRGYQSLHWWVELGSSYVIVWIGSEVKITEETACGYSWFWWIEMGRARHLNILLHLHGLVNVGCIVKVSWILAWEVTLLHGHVIIHNLIIIK